MCDRLQHKMFACYAVKLGTEEWIILGKTNVENGQKKISQKKEGWEAEGKKKEKLRKKRENEFKSEEVNQDRKRGPM